MTQPGKNEFFAYVFSQKRSANKGEKMPANEINLKNKPVCKKG